MADGTLQAESAGQFASRYRFLDPLRGIASAMVLIWHMYWDRTHWVDGFWLGVQIFFVISGYCIAAAVVSARRHRLPFRAFMFRRVRRIGMPYLGSIFLAIVSRFAMGFSDGGVLGGLEGVHYPYGYWLRNLTMTQWLHLTERWMADGRGLATPWFNPQLFLGVHWSLNYEEQFYLLAGILLAVSVLVRPSWVLGIFTAVIAAINVWMPGRITGLFFDYWLQFFCGVWLYLRLCQSPARRTRLLLDLGSVAVLVGIIALAWRRREYPLSNSVVQFYTQLAVCLAFAILLARARPLDSILVGSAPGRVLGGLGKFSYSLYLVHRPALELFRCAGWDVRRGPADLALFAAVLGSAYAFYCVFEKPFLNPPLSTVALPEPGRAELSPSPG